MSGCSIASDAGTPSPADSDDGTPPSADGDDGEILVGASIPGMGADGARPVISSLRTLLAHMGVPARAGRGGRLRLLFLDAGNGLIGDEAPRGGAAAPAALCPRALARRALALDAAAVILVREASGGAAAPTADDVALSRQVVPILAAADVLLHDYLVVAGGRPTSLRGLGLLPGYGTGRPPVGLS